METQVSGRKRKPGTVNLVHADPVRHGDGRGTAATARITGGSIIPVCNVRVYPYASGTATWDLTCPCGVNVRVTDYALLQKAVPQFALNPSATRIDLDITTL